MKKPYSKPMVTFEEYSLDTPLAANCHPDSDGYEAELRAGGYFNTAEGCYDVVTDEMLGGYFNSPDKVCYYSFAIMLFNS